MKKRQERGIGIFRLLRKMLCDRSERAKLTVCSTQHGKNVGLLRASVLGANDGIISTSSLLLGVAAAHGSHQSILVAGISGLVAGAMSMAASEYVSVHSQADTEEAEMALQRIRLTADKSLQSAGLAAIYRARGLDAELATMVAQRLIAFDQMGALTRDALGITEKSRAHPMQAAIASAGSFGLGGAVSLLVAIAVPDSGLIPIVSLTSIVLLALLGGFAAHAGGARVLTGALRVTLWGGLAMGMTSGFGWLVGILV